MDRLNVGFQIPSFLQVPTVIVTGSGCVQTGAFDEIKFSISEDGTTWYEFRSAPDSEPYNQFTMVQVSSSINYFDISLGWRSGDPWITTYFKFEDLTNGKHFICEVSLVAHKMTAAKLWKEDTTRIIDDTFYASTRRDDLIQHATIALEDGSPALAGTRTALMIKTDTYKVFSDEMAWA